MNAWWRAHLLELQTIDSLPISLNTPYMNRCLVQREDRSNMERTDAFFRHV